MSDCNDESIQIGILIFLLQGLDGLFYHFHLMDLNDLYVLLFGYLDALWDFGQLLELENVDGLCVPWYARLESYSSLVS